MNAWCLAPSSPSSHYGKTARCRATNRTAKGSICPAKALPCEVARQRSPGKDSDGNGIIAVRVANFLVFPLAPKSRGFGAKGNIQRGDPNSSD
jgi:hypothetical protein